MYRDKRSTKIKNKVLLRKHLAQVVKKTSYDVTMHGLKSNKLFYILPLAPLNPPSHTRVMDCNGATYRSGQ